MKKKESTFISMTTSLLVITLVAGFSLGFVNDLTVGPIAKAKLEKKVNLLKLVLPDFDNNPADDIQLIKSAKAKDSIEVYPAYLNNEFVGAAVMGTTDKGFSGLIKIMVGFTPKGAIINIAVLEQKETPGLGTKIKGETFLKQFKGLNLSSYKLKVKKDGGEIDAITGATISSRAFCEATQIAYDMFTAKNHSLIESEN